MTQSMISRVAIAIHDADWRGNKHTWDECPEQDQFRKQACAALECLLEPDREMRIAGLTQHAEQEERLREYWDHDDRQSREYEEGVKLMPTCSLLVRNDGEATAIFQAMIRKALDD